MNDVLKSTTQERSQIVRGLLAVLMGGVLVLGMHTSGSWILTEWFPYALWLLPGVATVYWLRRKDPNPSGPVGEERELWPGVLLLGCCVLYLLASPATAPYFFFIEWAPTGDGLGLWGSGLARFFLLAGGLSFLFLFRRPRPWALVLLVLLVCQFAAGWTFLAETDGRPLYGDDHPSFMMRLWIFGQTFPHLLYYSPLWNAGKAASYILSSGLLGLGVTFWPVWRWGTADLAYTPVLVAAFIVWVPLAAALAVRVAGGKATSAWSGAVLALCAGRLFFKWLLHFGTVGACFALPWVMVAAACLFRVLWVDRREWWCGALLVISSLFLLAWPPAVFMTLPVALALVASVGRMSKARLLFLGRWAVPLVVAYVPYVIVLLRHSAAVRYLGKTADASVPEAFLATGWQQLAEELLGANPALIFLGLLGVWFLRKLGARPFFGTLLLGYAVLTGWVGIWKPDWGIERAAIPFLFACVLPAALWLGDLLESRARAWAPLRAVALSLLLMGGWNAVHLFGNRGIARYRTRSPYMSDMVEWIRTQTPADGRILFAGPTVHGYGGGHVAFLPVETGREMMATDYYHFSPKMVEYEYPPRPFRESREGLLSFFDLYNVSHVITRKGNWIHGFRLFPNDFPEVAHFGNENVFSAFEVRRELSWFVEGSGTVDAGINSFRVHLDDPDHRAVIKYHWADGLRVKPPAVITPYDAGHEIQFIAIEPNGAEDIEIRYRQWI